MSTSLLLLAVLVLLLASACRAEHHPRPSAAAGAASSPSSGLATQSHLQDTDHKNDKKTLYWVGNHAGLFSHFMQLKLMYALANKLNRHLIVVPTKSVHYEVDIDMCRVFDLPRNVTCANLHNDSVCLDALPTSNAEQSICYRGSIKFGQYAKGREAILRGIEEELPLRFHPSILPKIEAFKAHLGFTEHNSAVVHWRRGDQLSSRCAHGADNSVNCKSGLALVKRVRRNLDAISSSSGSSSGSNSGSNSGNNSGGGSSGSGGGGSGSNVNISVVYVATNEPKDSPELAALAAAGFFFFHSVVNTATPMSNCSESSSSSGSGNGGSESSSSSNSESSSSPAVAAAPLQAAASSPLLTSLNLFDILAIEVSLMLQAHTFLAWGVSEMNDLVEWERYSEGREGSSSGGDGGDGSESGGETKAVAAVTPAPAPATATAVARKKSFCLDQDPIDRMEQLTWCAIHTGATHFDLDKTHMQHYKKMPTKRPTSVRGNGGGGGGKESGGGGGHNRNSRQQRRQQQPRLRLLSSSGEKE